jgi:hypothetical protein
MDRVVMLSTTSVWIDIEVEQVRQGNVKKVLTIHVLVAAA